MIVIYRSPGADFVAAAERLKAEGKQLHVDFTFKNELCFRQADNTVSLVYTNNPIIKAEYEAAGIECRGINE